MNASEIQVWLVLIALTPMVVGAVMTRLLNLKTLKAAQLREQTEVANWEREYLLQRIARLEAGEPERDILGRSTRPPGPLEAAIADPFGDLDELIRLAEQRAEQQR